MHEAEDSYEDGMYCYYGVKEITPKHASEEHPPSSGFAQLRASSKAIQAEVVQRRWPLSSSRIQARTVSLFDMVEKLWAISELTHNSRPLSHTTIKSLRAA